MVWQKSGPTWYCRVYNETGATRVCSTGTTEKAVADDVEALAERLRARRRWRLLNAIVAGRPGFELATVYDADVRSALESLEARLDDVDLAPLVAEWNGWGRKRRGPDPKYVRQVRRLIPEGTPFPRSQFTRRRIATFLRTLAVAEPTKNTYRSALFQFGRWLVEHEILDTNPVRDVDGFRASKARRIWFEPATAEAIVTAIGHPVVRAMHALMVATGAEWGACARATRRDLDLEGRTFYARGTKTDYRTRRVAIAPAPVHRAFAWALPILSDYVATLAPNAPLFPVSEKDALDELRAALKAVQISGPQAAATQHDWRHTFAVAFRRAHGDPAIARRQLGHEPTSNVYERVYGVYLAELGETAAKPNADAAAPDSAPTLHGVREA